MTSKKPTVYFLGEVRFEDWNDKNEVAYLEFVVDHPVLGDVHDVRTSRVLKKFDDDSFETRNTIYKPARTKQYD